MYRPYVGHLQLEDAEMLEMENAQLHQMMFQRGTNKTSSGGAGGSGSKERSSHSEKEKQPIDTRDARDRDTKHTSRLSPKRGDRKRTRT